ncbi:pyrimidine dimer DNA glycosylase/endonuclease V [Gleimia sp. 6138-11-ORH1]|uniref:pyrimidine dimer DNA glycosylase/endonuclease V n=1 Tax=Gleimia sp. 6138-11-ORH1 TaxID=2973937 RepID=UPI00216A20A0|nr:pyrimidine dimer DNA glycosylase/endonuclease V [Gleimia sp. 6138-11-ORH1]MCS4485169.1 pyrimidine dimer DNA glycosylase/endonuclease V [Gleimia sp. 6138-11-ORH1]
MRLWSIHPKYLDRQGLTACWREALLAQAVIAGRTKGYTRHPQLERFQSCERPLAAVGTYLSSVQKEATRRGYNFDASRIIESDPSIRITVTDGQVAYEREHLLRKLTERTPDWVHYLVDDVATELHPMFDLIPGPIASWERV